MHIATVSSSMSYETTIINWGNIEKRKYVELTEQPILWLE
jgi:hypothetical protein